MIEITIKEDSGKLIINGPAFSMLAKDEYTYLRKLAKALKERAQKEKQRRIRNEQRQDRQ